MRHALHKRAVRVLYSPSKSTVPLRQNAHTPHILVRNTNEIVVDLRSYIVELHTVSNWSLSTVAQTKPNAGKEKENSGIGAGCCTVVDPMLHAHRCRLVTWPSRTTRKHYFIKRKTNVA